VGDPFSGERVLSPYSLIFWYLDVIGEKVVGEVAH